MTAPAYMAEIFRFFSGFVLLFAVIGKVRTFNEFRRNLTESFGLTAQRSAGLAPIIVLTEFVLAAIILAHTDASYFGMLAALCLFSAFTAILSYRYLKEGVVKCSCFGETGRSVSIYDLARNLLIIACIACYLVYVGGGSILTLQVQLPALGLALILTVITVEFHEICMLIFHSPGGAHNG